MARALLLAHRHHRATDAFDSCVDVLNARITPDNIVPRKPKTFHDDGVFGAVFNPSGGTSVCAASICVGTLVGEKACWHRPGSAVPDGSFAILRSDRRYVELLADAVASRTLWYAMTDDIFIASTSQRIIVSLLGSFEPNPYVAPWMLSTGTLGPEGGWDSRLEQVYPGERITLDRKRWRLRRNVSVVEFRRARGVAEDDFHRELATTVGRLGRQLELDTAKWLVPLSGGVDSRGLLWVLREHDDIRTITWGLSAATRKLSSDARIARKIAEEFGVHNRYFPTNVSSEPREKLINRFLVAGEGRIANIPPFLDGFALWKTLYEEGIDGILRGDEAFGGGFVRDDAAVRNAAKLSLLSDHFDDDEIEELDLPGQKMPERLSRRPGETLSIWRDRLYQQHRLPILLSGLSDLQGAYVEVVNPLLWTPMLQLARRLPDHLRTNKRLWRNFVRSTSKIPFARRVAVLPLKDFLNDTSMLQLLMSEFDGAPDCGPLGPALKNRIVASLQATLMTEPVGRENVRTRGPLALIVPDGVRHAVRKWMPPKPELPPTVVAFRALIISRMHRLLKDDAEALLVNARHVVNL
jgi:hypothetical protein